MQLLLLSNAKREGMAYLEHATTYLREFFGSGVKEILFVPFARVNERYDEFVDQVRPVFASIGVSVRGIHTAPDPIVAINAAEAIVVGGGNTWKLLRDLHERHLLVPIRNRVLIGTPYAGWSAGANIACPTLMTTNDMPICNPGSFEALALVPFQINPHYLHGNPPGFKGETREERILEFSTLHPGVWTVGLREGTGLIVGDGALRLVGDAPCRVFGHGFAPRELTAQDDFGFLLGSADSAR